MKLITIEDVTLLINNLDTKHKTIGNYYLINNKNIHKFK